MRRVVLPRAVWITLAVALLPVSVFGDGLEERRWIEVRTPNFLIRSLLSEQRTIDAARELEVFRIIVSLVTNVASTDSPIPTEVFLLSGGEAKDSFSLGINTAGVFRTGLRNNTIIVHDTIGVDKAAIIKHEYVHFIIRNSGSLNYPTWFHEGFAEYLAATDVDDDVVTVGAVPEYRLWSLKQSRWLHMRQILAYRPLDGWNPEKRSMFYAEAWALVHFLLNQEDKERPFDRQLKRYVELVESGYDAVPAFEAAFAIDVSDLNRDVRRYLKGTTIPGFRIAVDRLLPEFAPGVRQQTREEASLALGQAALRLDNLDEAEHWFGIAATDERLEPWARAGLGDVYKFRGDYEEARPHFEAALALAPDDLYVRLDVAEYWQELAEAAESPEDRDAYLDRAREHFVAAIEMNASAPEALAMYGETYLIEGREYETAVEYLERAEQLLPSHLSIRAMLAEAYLGTARLGDAEQMAQSVLAWTHEESDTAKRAQEVLDSVSAAGKGAAQVE